MQASNRLKLYMKSMHAYNNNPSIDRFRSAVLQNKDIYARIQELLKEEAKAEEDHNQETCLDENGEPACAVIL